MDCGGDCILVWIDKEGKVSVNGFKVWDTDCLALE